jgi:hypothetical protein
MLHKPTPQVVSFVKLFGEEAFADLKRHVHEVRRLFDWPGIPYHDHDAASENKFNRWHWNNLPLLTTLHHSAAMRAMVSKLAGVELKPSYNFLSMYGPDGVCPLHQDRPQCQFTLDLCISQDETWPIYVDEAPFVLAEAEGLFYSGTGQPHYRKPMKTDSHATFCNLAFFHFVPTTWQGSLT